MARKIIHQLIDDLTGEAITEGSGITVTFSIDGVTYEIDLNDENATRMRAAFAPYIAAGRKVATKSSTNSPGSKKAASPHDLGAIREWANSHDLHVSSRGRIAGSVIDAYYAAH